MVVFAYQWLYRLMTTLLGVRASQTEPFGLIKDMV